MINFKFNQDKAIAAVLFIADRLIKRHGKNGANLHKIFKILYFADRKYLAEYGRPIVGDFYVAMREGGVPSRIYDMVKMVRGDSICKDTEGFNKFFDVSEYFLFPKQKPAMEEFSRSDLECLKESIVKNQDLKFSQLKKKSHDQAYQKAGKNDKISFWEMAKVSGADKTTLEYMKLYSENESILNT